MDASIALRPQFLRLHDPESADLASELAAGLLRPDAAIAPKFFYDALGSHLFAAITCVPEYTPTRAEAAIFDAHCDEIADEIGPGSTLIDLGAGDCAKAARLFGPLSPRQYVAVDISIDYLERSLACLQPRFPEIEMLGVGLDFSREWSLPPTVSRRDRLVFYPGSSIGNFAPAEADRFLRGVRSMCAAGIGLLIGFDLVKDKEKLDAAYDDALGVTAAFNRNALLHANRLLGADFDLVDWKHVAFYVPQHSRVEMHLEARRDVCVRWIDPAGTHARKFVRGERIHTENSHKFRLPDLRGLLARAGFGAMRAWTDPSRGYAVVLARPTQ